MSITLFSKHTIFQQIGVIIDHALLTNVNLISLPQLTPCYTVKLFYLKEMFVCLVTMAAVIHQMVIEEENYE